MTIFRVSTVFLTALSLAATGECCESETLALLLLLHSGALPLSSSEKFSAFLKSKSLVSSAAAGGGRLGGCLDDKTRDFQITLER